MDLLAFANHIVSDARMLLSAAPDRQSLPLPAAVHGSGIIGLN